jgi:tRNA (guanine-N7-)-methyltransferase
MKELRRGINPKVEGFERLDWAEVFGADRPLIVEIGSGKGRFLIEAGELRPDCNFVGIERSLHFFRFILDRLDRRRLPNVVIVNDDGLEVLRKMFQAESVDELHIYFPDPWPRPRERKRRLMREETMREIERVLKPGAEAVYVTDHLEYFEKTVPLVMGFFQVVRSGEVPAERKPRTNYEAKYRVEGRPIFEIVFRRK